MSPEALEPGLLDRLPEPPRKVAVLRASRIGDFICAIPALRALRLALPAAEISMITLPMLEELAVRCRHLDRFIPFPGYPGIAEQFFDPRKTAAFFNRMQAERFDLAVQMQGSGVNSNPFTLMLGARYTAGYIRPGDSPGLLDAALPIPDRGHEVERALALTRFLGIPDRGLHTEYGLLPEDHAEAEQLLAGAEAPLIGLHPAARVRTRRWPPERFAQVARLLQARYGGTLVFIGEAAEAGDIRRLQSRLAQAGCRGINLAGRTRLGPLGAVIDRLAVLITNDSGPAHIAYALGRPAITVFGSQDPRRYAALHPGPFHTLVYDIPCRPCDYVECPIGYECLERVGVGEVLEAAEQVLGGQGVLAG